LTWPWRTLFYRGCADEDGGKTRIALEGYGRPLGLKWLTKPVMGLGAVVTLVVGLFIRSR